MFLLLNWKSGVRVFKVCWVRWAIGVALRPDVMRPEPQNDERGSYMSRGVMVTL